MNKDITRELSRASQLQDALRFENYSSSPRTRNPSRGNLKSSPKRNKQVISKNKLKKINKFSTNDIHGLPEHLLLDLFESQSKNQHQQSNVQLPFIHGRKNLNSQLSDSKSNGLIQYLHTKRAESRNSLSGLMDEHESRALKEEI